MTTNFIPRSLPLENNNSHLFNENLGLWHIDSNRESLSFYNTGPQYKQLTIQLNNIINKTTNFAFNIFLNSDNYLTS